MIFSQLFFPTEGLTYLLLSQSTNVCTCVLVAQLCPTLCSPMDCSPLGSSVHRILQARTLEWVVVFLLQGIFWTQGLNLCLLVSCIACRFFWIFQARVLEWVTIALVLLLFSLFLSPIPDNELIESRMFVQLVFFYLYLYYFTFPLA